MSPMSRSALRASLLIGLTTAFVAPISIFLDAQMNLASPIIALAIKAAIALPAMLCISNSPPLKNFLR